MWVRHRLDFGWWDAAYGVTQLFQPRDRNSLARAVEKHWPPGNTLAILSVRSGLDLLLGAMQWPAGSEIVYSALNIPDMTMVARQHGVVPVPADLDLERLAPNLKLLEQAITPRTRAILIAHLYGNFVALDPIVALARKHQLLVIEDCAENFDGVYPGHPEADVSLFSFGPLKTATALAGGVLRAKDAQLFKQLQGRHDRWPVQSRWDYSKRITKYSALKFFSSKWIYAGVRKVAKLLVGNVDTLIHHSAKSFRDDEIMKRLRQRPCGPLLAAMARRLANFDHERLRQRTTNGKHLTSLLRGHVDCPAAEVEPHNYWLFPALTSDPGKAMATLEAAGFDATLAESMRAVDAPPDRPDLDPVEARRALQHMIMLPCYPGIPEAELSRMAAVLIRVEQESSQVSALKVTMRPADTVYGAGAAAREETTSAMTDTRR
jgi:perosamine synthetase